MAIIRGTSGVPQGSVLGPVLFLAYVNDIWRNIESTIRLFADVCVMYKKISKREGIEKLQKHLDRLGEWAVESAMKINPGKCKAVRFTRARVKDPLNYTLGNQSIPESNSCKYLGIIIRSDLSWADHVNYTVKKAWKALHFIRRILKKGNSKTKSLVCTSLLRPILENGAACWEPYRDGQIHALDRVQNEAAKFAYHTNETNCETLTQRRKLARICALHKAYSGEQAWKAVGDRLKRPYYLSRVDHDWKIRNRRQRADMWKYSFVNRTIRLCNWLPAEIFGAPPVN